MPEEEAALDLAEQSPLAFIFSTPSRLTSLVAFIQEGLLLGLARGVHAWQRRGKKKHSSTC